MKEFIRLSCPACGGHLEITDNINQFVCLHCGTEHVVDRGAGFVSLQPITQGLSRIQAGTDRTADELAAQRMRFEITELNEKRSEREQVLKMNEAKRTETQTTRGQILNRLIAVSLLAALFFMGLVMSLSTEDAQGGGVGFIVILLALSVYGYTLYTSYSGQGIRLATLEQGRKQILTEIADLDIEIARTQDRLQQTVARLRSV